MRNDPRMTGGRVPVNKIIPFSSVDGPGNRTAVFVQGCNFNCHYCHNPETRATASRPARSGPSRAQPKASSSSIRRSASAATPVSISAPMTRARVSAT